MPYTRGILYVILVSVCLTSCRATVTYHPYNTPESDKYILYTGPEINKDDNIIHLEGYRSFTFKLRACSEGHVFLRDSANTQSDYKATDVLIGGKDNTVSSIGIPRAVPDVEVETPDLLHCSELRDFWLSWNKTTIQVGRGPIPSFQQFMQATWPKDAAHDVLTATVSTGNTYAGTWEFDENTGRGITVTTHEQRSYTHLWRTVENRPRFLAFSVKTSSDVSVGFGPKTGDAYYQIKFGFGSGNTTVQIGDTVIGQVTTPLGSHGDYSAGFWISWEDGNQISAGKGLYPGRGQPIIDTSVFNMFPVGSVGFASQESATWDFHSDAEDFYVFHSDPGETDITFENWLRTPLVRGLTFFVQACDAVHLAIAKDTNSSDPNNIIITIGNRVNATAGYIQVQQNGNEMVTQDVITPLLICDATRSFWITWGRSKQIKIGQGLTSGIRPLLSHNLPDDLDYHVIGFGSGSEVVTWMLHPLQGDDVIIVTHERLGPYASSIPMLHDYYRTFKLKTDGSARLLIGEGITRDMLDLTLGVNNIRNQTAVTWMYSSSGSTDQKVCTHNDDVISDTEALDYWISWRSGNFIFGLGQEPGKNELRGQCDTLSGTSSTIPVPFNARAIGVHSTQQAEWTFPAEKVDELIFNPPDQATSNVYRWIKLADDKSESVNAIVFRFKGLKGLELLLAPVYNDEKDATKITFGAMIEFQKGTETKSFSSQDVLRDDVLVDFWIRRQGNTLLEMGHGKRGQNKLGDFTVPGSKYKVKGLAFKNTQGTQFRTPVYTGNELKFSTATVSGKYDQVIHQVRSRDALFFATTACNNKAEILLSPTEDGHYTDDSYRVKINTNAVSIAKGSADRASLDLKEPLSCEEDTIFWMSWGVDGEIVLGRGEEEVLINWYDLEPYPVHALGFSNGYNRESRAEWKLRLASGNRFEDIDWVDHGNRKPIKASGLSGGEIAGIIIGLILLAAIVGIIVVVVRSGVPAPIENAWSSVRNKFGGDSSQTTRLTEEMTSAENENAS